MFDEYIWDEAPPGWTPFDMPDFDLNLIISYALAVVQFINRHNIIGIFVIMALAVSIAVWAYTFAVKKRPESGWGSGLIEDIEEVDPSKLSKQWSQFGNELRRRKFLRF